MANAIDRVSEKRPEGLLASRITKLGGLTYKWTPVVAGLPDRIVIIDGTVYFVELKADDGALSKIQQVIHKKIEKRGVPVYVLTGRQGVLDWLEAMKSGTLGDRRNW